MYRAREHAFSSSQYSADGRTEFFIHDALYDGLPHVLLICKRSLLLYPIVDDDDVVIVVGDREKRQIHVMLGTHEKFA